MLNYCIILLYFFHNFIQGIYHCSIWALNNDFFGQKSNPPAQRFKQ